jgi:hypothetical protein
MLEKVKGAAQYLSEGKLYENRKEHIKACRETVGYKGDIKWTDNNGLKHSAARGASATDWGGEQRAYSHHILGTQHVFVCIIHTFISLTSDGCNSRVLSTMTNIICTEHRDGWGRVHGLVEPST